MAMLSNLKSTVYPPLQPVPELAARRQQNHTEAAYVIPQIAHPTSTAERWASYVLRACESERDPRTLGIWAREVAVSYTTLCESCRLVGVSPRAARDFARVLRVLLMSSFGPCIVTSFLDISDRRTLDSILRKAGFGSHAILSGDVSVVSFLDSQQFVAIENPGLKIIRDVLVSA
jgi:hypothetical protein